MCYYTLLYIYVANFIFCNNMALRYIYTCRILPFRTFSIALSTNHSATRYHRLYIFTSRLCCMFTLLKPALHNYVLSKRKLSIQLLLPLNLVQYPSISNHCTAYCILLSIFCKQFPYNTQ